MLLDSCVTANDELTLYPAGLGAPVVAASYAAPHLLLKTADDRIIPCRIGPNAQRSAANAARLLFVERRDGTRAGVVALIAARPGLWRAA